MDAAMNDKNEAEKMLIFKTLTSIFLYFFPF